jgi:hypothetical protein
MNIPTTTTANAPRGSDSGAGGLETILVLLIAMSACHADQHDTGNWLTASDTSATITLRESKHICSDCIELTKIATLGADTSHGLTGPARQMVRDSLHRYWIGQSRQMMKVFDSSGRFVRAVGRRGRGPGEFEYSWPIHVGGDGNVHIFDGGLQRETIMGPDFELRSMRPFPSGTDVAWAAPIPGRDEFVLADPFYAPTERIGPGLFIARGPDTLRSIGPSLASPPKTLVSPQILSVDTGGRIYSIRFTDYTIEAWTYEGRRLGTFAGPVLNPALSRDDPAALAAVANYVYAMHADGTGRVWVLSKWLREKWRDYYKVQDFEGHRMLVLKDSIPKDSIFRSRIDVIDLRTREIIATRMIEGQFEMFVGEDLVQNVITDDGVPLAVIWRARLKAR